jgi:hypothetical protein
MQDLSRIINRSTEKEGPLNLLKGSNHFLQSKEGIRAISTHSHDGEFDRRTGCTSSLNSQIVMTTSFSTSGSRRRRSHCSLLSHPRSYFSSFLSHSSSPSAPKSSSFSPHSSSLSPPRSSCSSLSHSSSLSAPKSSSFSPHSSSLSPPRSSSSSSLSAPKSSSFSPSSSISSSFSSSSSTSLSPVACSTWTGSPSPPACSTWTGIHWAAINSRRDPQILISGGDWRFCTLKGNGAKIVGMGLGATAELFPSNGMVKHMVVVYSVKKIIHIYAYGSGV